MSRRFVLIGALLLASCHRPHADQPAPGADSDALAQTAAKTAADLQAADEAARGPAPEIAPIVHHDPPPAPTKKAAAAPAPLPADETVTEAPPPAEANQTTP